MTLGDRTCIFNSSCSKEYCDMSCPKNVMSEVLLEKCGIVISDSMYTVSEALKQDCWNILESHTGEIITVFNNDPITKADTFIFAGICKMCQGHGTAINVYHLKFTKYIQMIRDSWAQGVGQDLQEAAAYVKTSKILIISGLDYFVFKDFESQTLLNILQDRSQPDQITVVVVRSIDSLVGTGSFFVPLKNKLKEVTINA